MSNLKQYVKIQIKKIIALFISLYCMIRSSYNQKIETPITQNQSPFFSIISAVYNVENYLEDFITSFVGQSLDFQTSAELIFIDDGSTDSSKIIIEKWREIYPDRIKYFYKENGGQSTARNYGLPYARGVWVTFADPDDFVDRNYLKNVFSFINSNESSDVEVIACLLKYYDESTGRITNNHPLRRKFYGKKVNLIKTMRNEIQLAVNSSFYRKDLLDSISMEFNPQIRPSFEDAEFVSRFLILNMDRKIAFLKDAIYLYRKRADQSSTLDKSITDPRTYSDQLEYGYLGLIRFAQNVLGYIPQFVQTTVLYSISWQIKLLVETPGVLNFMSEKQKETYRLLLEDIFKYIDVDVIGDFPYYFNKLSLYFKIGIIENLKKTRFLNKTIYFQKVDKKRNLIKLYYHTYFDHNLEVFIDGRFSPNSIVESKRRKINFVDQAFVYEKIFWINLENAKHTIAFKNSNDPSEQFQIKIGQKYFSNKMSVPFIFDYFQYNIGIKKINKNILNVKQQYNAQIIKRKFQNAWILMDRDIQADDNAEHFYAYIQRFSTEINAFFVLRKNTKDWGRLNRKNFNLIEYGSQDHTLALLHADHLISSHIDNYIVKYINKEHYRDLVHYKFTFLQHGVTVHDVSKWLNTKTIDTFVTSTKAEYQSIVKEDSPYRFTNLEVVLTGMPRHDSLKRISEKVIPNKEILIMPTWRRYLASKSVKNSSLKQQNEAFCSTDFFSTWMELLNSEELKSLSISHGYQILFFLHSMFYPYLDLFEVPNFITKATHTDFETIQQVFSSSALMITDYSSVAFEMAYIDRPVIYYQFDRQRVFSDPKQVYSTGYFDYEQHGFGPVCETKENLLIHLGKLLEIDGKPEEKYLERMNFTFPYKDGRCSERIFNRLISQSQYPE